MFATVLKNIKIWTFGEKFIFFEHDTKGKIMFFKKSFFFHNTGVGNYDRIGPKSAHGNN